MPPARFAPGHTPEHHAMSSNADRHDCHGALLSTYTQCHKLPHSTQRWSTTIVYRCEGEKTPSRSSVEPAPSPTAAPPAPLPTAPATAALHCPRAPYPPLHRCYSCSCRCCSPAHSCCPPRCLAAETLTYVPGSFSFHTPPAPGATNFAGTDCSGAHRARPRAFAPAPS